MKRKNTIISYLGNVKFKTVAIVTAILILTNLTSIFITKYFEESYYFKRQTFIDLNKAVYDSRVIVENDNGGKFALLEAKYAEQPGKYSDLYEEAIAVEAFSDSLVTYIEELKIVLLDGLAVNGESTNNIFYKVRFKTLPDYVFDTLDSFIIDYINLMGRNMDEDDTSYYNNIDSCFNQIRLSERQISTKTYRNVTNIEAVILLSYLQLKVRHALSYFMDYVVGSLESNGYMSSRDSYVRSSSVVVKKGSVFSAEILCASRERWFKPIYHVTYDKPFYDSVEIDGYFEYRLKRGIRYEIINSNKDGIGEFKANCDKPGLYEFGGLIQYVKYSGDTWVPFKSQYYVTE
jgi:hypothetical protein